MKSDESKRDLKDFFLLKTFILIYLTLSSCYGSGSNRLEYKRYFFTELGLGKDVDLDLLGCCDDD